LVSWLRQRRALADVNGIYYRDLVMIFPHTKIVQRREAERRREDKKKKKEEEEERKAKANYACVGLLRLRPAAPCNYSAESHTAEPAQILVPEISKTLSRWLYLGEYHRILLSLSCLHDSGNYANRSL
jgi:hypothetical protein